MGLVVRRASNRGVQVGEQRLAPQWRARPPHRSTALGPAGRGIVGSPAPAKTQIYVVSHLGPTAKLLPQRHIMAQPAPHYAQRKIEQCHPLERRRLGKPARSSPEGQRCDARTQVCRRNVRVQTPAFQTRSVRTHRNQARLVHAGETAEETAVTRSFRGKFRRKRYCPMQPESVANRMSSSAGRVGIGST